MTPQDIAVAAFFTIISITLLGIIWMDIAER